MFDKTIEKIRKSTDKFNVTYKPKDAVSSVTNLLAIQKSGHLARIKLAEGELPIYTVTVTEDEKKALDKTIDEMYATIVTKKLETAADYVETEDKEEDKTE